MFAPHRLRPSPLSLSLAVATLFLLTHPYTGIYRGAVLYTAQALYNANPGHFVHDLFFEFGSQDDWTVYGRLYSKLVSAFGIRISNLACLIAFQALWWTGMWRLARRLLSPPWHWLCLSLIACMPSEYGASSIFSYNEFFLTARLPAEAFSIWALALMIEHRARMAVALSLIATAIHPLIGATVLAITVLSLITCVRWWALFAFALPVFAIIELLPLHALRLHPFDPEWLAVAQYNLPSLFPTLWNTMAWDKACWAIALPAALFATRTQEYRALWSHVTLLAVAGLAVSTVAALTAQDAAWIQIQSWRTLWLSTLMQWPAAILLIRRELRTRPLLIWLLAICWLLLGVGGGVLALLIAIALHVDARRLATGNSLALFHEITPLIRFLLICGTLIAAIIWFGYQVAYYSWRALNQTGGIAFKLRPVEALIHTHLVVALVALLVLLNLSRNRMSILGLPLLMAALLTYGLVNFDQRSAPTKIMESRVDDPNLAPFHEQVPHGSMVYWDGAPGEVVYPWLMMKASSYYSQEQTAGIIFHRQTTFEAARRLAWIKQDPLAGRPHSDDKADERSSSFFSRQPFAPLTLNGLHHVCADPLLDFVVTSHNYPDLSTNQQWSPDTNIHYWLYNCRHIRAAASKPTWQIGAPPISDARQSVSANGNT
ncbi:hypothetical protein J8I87_18005 [Paraburkholderia sp. LEh10]|uniref:hypothetical protein n=1 Tax=Paraburkholderia sp. LEh10 TaxID=2821353 RepID=UPI001AE1EF99|nr:hypothetical protein [Paraburkholderia sp. LEh10]MBP0591586.1 hypothetical protein [Paraburkholderia sp. LEh10]